MNRRGYRLYDQDKQKVIHSRDVIFDESSNIASIQKEFTSQTDTTSQNTLISIDHDSYGESEKEDEHPLN